MMNMRLFAIVLSLLFLAFPLAYALENDSELPPPAPPSEGTVFATAMLANGSLAPNSAIILLAKSNKSEVVYRTITDKAGKFILSLDKGIYEIDALLDDYSTPGIDFAATASADFTRSQNITIVFYPSGSLSGKTIEASDSGAPVPSARVFVSCPSAFFDYGRINGETQMQSGEAGDFLFRVLPVGSCIVSASTDSLAGTADVQISNGKSTSATIGMKKKSGSLDFLLVALAAAAIIGVVAVVAYGRAWSKGQPPLVHSQAGAFEPAHLAKGKIAKHASPEKEPSKFDASSQKAKAILSTLSDREAEIVKFLCRQNGRAKRSQIQHKLLIPKTSLLRNLRSLERKNIVKLTPFGRNLLAELEEKLFS